MKKIFLLALILISGMLSTELSVKANPVSAEAKPSFKTDRDGRSFSNIRTYMARYVKYPEGSDSFGLIGTTVVEFTVTTTGNVTDIKVLNSISKSSDAEVIKVLKTTNGKWKPGSKNGSASNMKTEVSVVFKPNVNYNLDAIALKSKTKGRKLMLEDKDYAKALKSYNKAVQLSPYELSFIAERGLCKYESGDVNGAMADWNRIVYLNKFDPMRFHFFPAHVDPALSSLKGFSKLKSMLQ